MIKVNPDVDFDKKVREKQKEIKSKRARLLLELLLENKEVTTKELNEKGYDHPPRVARDLREAGIPLITKMATVDGVRMGVYSLDKTLEISESKAGRRQFSKALKDALLKKDGEKCGYCNGKFPGRALQIDHKVPYEVGGDDEEEIIDDFMLLCGSCNRSKSWTCENCNNWNGDQDVTICLSCMWGSPESYKHIAMNQKRRLEIVWEESEVMYFDQAKTIVEKHEKSLADHIKQTLKDQLAVAPKIN